MNLGPHGHDWLASLFTRIHTTGIIPSTWQEAKVIAILKPGKPAAKPSSYRPIPLLCTTYKWYEHFLLAKLAPLVQPDLPKGHAGFRPGRSCVDQVLALTIHIENAY